MITTLHIKEQDDKRVWFHERGVSYEDLIFTDFCRDLVHGPDQFAVDKIETDFEAGTRVIFCHKPEEARP